MDLTEEGFKVYIGVTPAEWLQRWWSGKIEDTWINNRITGIAMSLTNTLGR